MGRKSFSEGTRFYFFGDHCLIKKKLVGGRFEIENFDRGGIDIRTLDELLKAYTEKKLIFPNSAQNSRIVDGNALPTEYTFADFQSLPDDYQIETWYRYCLIYPFIKLSKKDRTRNSIKAYYDLHTPKELPAHLFMNIPESVTRRLLSEPLPSNFTLFDWLRDFLNSGRDIRSLVPAFNKRGAPGVSKLHPEVNEIIDRVLKKYAKDDQPYSRHFVYVQIVNEIVEVNRGRSTKDELLFKIPSEPTIVRRINDHPLKSAILGRKPSKLEKQADESVGEGPEAKRVLERVEIDHTPIDLQVVDNADRYPIGRPTLTVAIDVHSRMIVGFYLGFEPPSYLTVMSCLLHSILPKPNVREEYTTKNDWPVWGLPETLITDNGKEFIGKDLRDACGQLGVLLEQLPVHDAWFKGKVERFFRTLNDELIHMLPGTTFSNFVEKGDYDSLKHSCISLNGLLQILHIFLLDIYAQDWHEGIEDVPIKRWNRNIQEGFIPELPDNVDDVRIMLSRTDERIIQREGIEFECLWYQSDELGRIRSCLLNGSENESRSVKIKYDPYDLGSIHVLDKTGEFEKWIPVPAVGQDYAKGLSLRLHLLARSLVHDEKKKVNLESLAEAQQRILEAAATEYEKTKYIRGRKGLARLPSLEEIIDQKKQKRKQQGSEKANAGASVKGEKKHSAENSQETRLDNQVQKDQDINGRQSSDDDGWSSSYGAPLPQN